MYVFYTKFLLHGHMAMTHTDIFLLEICPGSERGSLPRVKDIFQLESTFGTFSGFIVHANHTF